MPEGDTVWLSARRLDQALSGEVLERAELRVPAFATSDLTGRKVLEVVARGKHILHRFSEGLTLHTHLGMDGAWHIYERDGRWRRPGSEARVVLSTNARGAVGFSLGSVELLVTEEEGDVIGHLGPDLLGPDWDPIEAGRRLSEDPKRPLGDALLDQRVMAGLGNVYRSEICFLSGVDPWTPVGDVDVASIVGLSKRVIEANRTTGRQITTGDARPGRQRWVYGRRSRPCRRCGTAIRYEQRGPGERVVYWCPTCQPPVASLP